MAVIGGIARRRRTAASIVALAGTLLTARVVAAPAAFAAATSYGTIATVGVGVDPGPLAINQATGTTYVGNSPHDAQITALDLAHPTDTAQAIEVGTLPDGVDVDQTSHEIDVADTGSQSVSVLEPGDTTQATAVTVASSAAVQAGEAATVTATVAPAPSGGTVDFTTEGSAIYGCGSVPVDPTTGSASCTLTFTASGDTSVRATYSGSSGYAIGFGDLDLTVVPRLVTFAGSRGRCTASKGALVTVDFGPWSGPLVRGCDRHPSTGIDLLRTAGFTTAGDKHDGPEFVCRIGSSHFDGGTQYPTPTQDPCVATPPAAAYWSYWIAPAGRNTWTYSPYDAYSDHPAAGEVEAWVYGGVDIAGTAAQPTFTPAEVRAQDLATKPDRHEAVHYLTTTTRADGLVGGTSLAKDGYYESSADFVDFGLTLDGAFALAATGSDDKVLNKVVKFVASASADGSGRTVNDWTAIGTKYADGGAIGKEALLAEIAGYNPRNFAGHNLIRALNGLICAKKSTPKGCAAAGNYRYATSTFAQALGVIAQLRAGDTANAKPAIAYLESLQNSEGAFPSVIPSSGDSDVDSTGEAAMALALVKGSRAAAAVDTAATFLADSQLPDGGFPGTSGESTNSTALAVQGLTLAGSAYRDQINAAISFLASQQNNDGGFTVGTDGQQGSDVRASAQAVGGIVGTSLGTLSDHLVRADQIRLSTSMSHSIVKGHKATLHAVATDKTIDAPLPHVVLDLLTRAGRHARWTHASKSTTSANGKASITVKPTSTRQYRWQYSGTSSRKAATSKTFTIRVHRHKPATH